MRRFLFDPGLIVNGLVKLDYDESHHLCKVLRLQAGEKIELIDGRGALFNAKVAELGKQVVVQLLDQVAAHPETNTPLTLCQGDLKGKNGLSCAEMHRTRSRLFHFFHKQPQPGES